MNSNLNFLPQSCPAPSSLKQGGGSREQGGGGEVGPSLNKKL